MRARAETLPWVPWRVAEQRGRAKLDVRFSDGSRAYAVLPVSWSPAQARAIQQMVEDIARQLATGRTFNEALQVVVGATPAAPTPAATPSAEQLLAA